MAVTVHVTPEHLACIRREALAHLPGECCGVLIGRAIPDGIEVCEVHPVPNRCDPPATHRYLIDPLEHLRLQRDARERGLAIVGFYHSHPDGCPEPSPTDRAGAWPGYCHLIAAVEGDAVREIRGWIFDTADPCGEAVSIPVRIACGPCRSC